MTKRVKYGKRLEKFLKAYSPKKTSVEIAKEIGAGAEYVRATAKRQGLVLTSSR